MMTFLTIIHMLIAIVLIALVLLQDSKGGGALGIGGGSNSLLGATGAQTLAAKITRIVAILFAMTCVALAAITANQKKSVVDSLPATPAAPISTSAPATTGDSNAASATTNTAPAANTAQPKTDSAAPAPAAPADKK